MIDELDIEEYRRVKAPVSLKKSVISAVGNTSKKRSVLSPSRMRIISGLAACFLVFFALGMFLKLDSSSVSVTVNEQSVSMANLRSSSYVSIIISCNKGIIINTENEGFYISGDNEKKEIIHSFETEENKVEILWLVSDEDSFLEINGEKYRVSHNADEAAVNIEKIK